MMRAADAGVGDVSQIGVEVAGRDPSRTLRELRRRAKQRLRGLHLPASLDLAGLIRLVADARARPILLQPMAGIGGQTMGAWIPTPDLDLIVYEKRTTRLHQDHIVLHELSHLICGHRARVIEPGAAAKLFPDLRPDAVRAALARHGYSSADEVEAEVMASVLSAQVHTAPEPAAPGDGEDAAVMRRLEAFSQGESLS
jgi:hypothetical protein